MQAFNEQEEQGLALVGQAEDLVVNDQETFAAGVALRKTIDAYLDEVHAITGPVKSATHAAWKAAVAQEQKLEAHALEARKILNKALGDYERRQQELAQEARRAAERVQREAEAAARAEAARTQKPVAVPVVFTPPPPPVPKAAGITFVDTWKFEILDASLIPRDYLVPDEKKIGQVVRAMKAATKIDGVRVYSERSARG